MTDRELLRHAVAVIAYRGGKPLRGVPDSFPSFDTGGGQTPRLILAHLADLLEWALSHVRGEPKWPQVDAGAWSVEAARFYAALDFVADIVAGRVGSEQSPPIKPF